jgi:class 3 adenylate cyclase
VTFLFTDIEGSTGSWEAAPDAMRAALERHDSVLRGAVDEFGGYVFSTGQHRRPQHPHGRPRSCGVVRCVSCALIATGVRPKARAGHL